MKKKLYFLFVSILFNSLLYPMEDPYTLVTEVWPPFRIEKSSNVCEYGGIDIDLVHELERRLGVQILLEFCPWARALEEIKTGRADLIIGFAYTEERALFASYIPVSYASVEPVFYAPAELGNQVVEYGDLSGRKIGISRKSAYFEPFNSDNSLDKCYLKAEKQILDMLAQKRIDLGVGTNPNMAYDIARYGYRDLLELTEYRPGPVTDLYLAFSRKSSKIDAFNSFKKAIEDILSDGTMDIILNKYR